MFSIWHEFVKQRQDLRYVVEDAVSRLCIIQAESMQFCEAFQIALNSDLNRNLQISELFHSPSIQSSRCYKAMNHSNDSKKMHLYHVK